jgi:hypothetical protein
MGSIASYNAFTAFSIRVAKAAKSSLHFPRFSDPHPHKRRPPSATLMQYPVDPRTRTGTTGTPSFDAIIAAPAWNRIVSSLLCLPGRSAAPTLAGDLAGCNAASAASRSRCGRHGVESQRRQVEIQLACEDAVPRVLRVDEMRVENSCACRRQPPPPLPGQAMNSIGVSK